jgi:hypothetical protein
MNRIKRSAQYGVMVFVIGMAGCNKGPESPDAGVPKAGSDDEIWSCWDQIIDARTAYLQMNLDLVEGLPKDASPQLPDEPESAHDIDLLAIAANEYEPPDIVNMSDAASEAFEVLMDFNQAFYLNVVLYNPGLQYCSDLLAGLQQQDGYFGDPPGGGGGGGGGGLMASKGGGWLRSESTGQSGGGYFSDADGDGDSAGTAPTLPTNCKATVHAVWISSAAGAVDDVVLVRARSRSAASGPPLAPRRSAVATSAACSRRWPRASPCASTSNRMSCSCPRSS